MHFYVKNMGYELNDQVIKLDEPSSYYVPRIRKQKKSLIDLIENLLVISCMQSLGTVFLFIK